MGGAAVRGRPRAWAAAQALLLLGLPSLALACPTCKDALTDNPEAKGFAMGIFLSIVVMLGVFFSLVGFFIYKLVQSARRESAEAPDPAPKD